MGDQGPVVPLAALARTRSAGARVDAPVPPVSNYLSAETTVRLCPEAVARTRQEFAALCPILTVRRTNDRQLSIEYAECALPDDFFLDATAASLQMLRSTNLYSF